MSPILLLPKSARAACVIALIVDPISLICSNPILGPYEIRPRGFFGCVMRA
jgi:hypothetical protein